jgi:hypothetical protein
MSSLALKKSIATLSEKDAIICPLCMAYGENGDSHCPVRNYLDISILPTFRQSSIFESHFQTVISKLQNFQSSH